MMLYLRQKYRYAMTVGISSMKNLLIMISIAVVAI